MTILIVSANEQRRERLKEAIHAAGFRTISANALDAAWTRTDYFDFDAVVIDHDFSQDIAASAFRLRFITLMLEENAAPEAVGLELAGLLKRASALVQ